MRTSFLEYGWNILYCDIAVFLRGGGIIRTQLLQKNKEAFDPILSYLSY